VVVPLNVLLRAPEIANHLEDSGALVLITWEGVLAEAVMDAEAAGNGAIFAVGHAPSLPRRLYPGVFGDVLLEIGDEFRGKGVRRVWLMAWRMSSVVTSSLPCSNRTRSKASCAVRRAANSMSAGVNSCDSSTIAAISSSPCGTAAR
jgi:hypothetical protein